MNPNAKKTIARGMRKKAKAVENPIPINANAKAYTARRRMPIITSMIPTMICSIVRTVTPIGLGGLNMTGIKSRFPQIFYRTLGCYETFVRQRE
jgi:hypothetical protein